MILLCCRQGYSLAYVMSGPLSASYPTPSTRRLMNPPVDAYASVSGINDNNINIEKNWNKGSLNAEAIEEIGKQLWHTPYKPK